MSITALLGALELGFIYALMGFGIYITFRILHTPDLTTDGSFVLGAAVSAVFTLQGMPEVGILAAVLAGALAGMITALLHTKLGIQPLLAGILTATGLYTINLVVMHNKSNLPLIGQRNVFTALQGVYGGIGFRLLLLVPMVVLLLLALRWFFKTQLGLSIRATGDNPAMVRASSINTDGSLLFGYALANACVALAGAMVAQLQQSADVTMGSGIVVVGMASLIIGEVIIKNASVTRGLAGVTIGSVLYRVIIAAILTTSLPASSLKLISALVVAVATAIPGLRRRMELGRLMRRERSRNA